MINEYVTRIDSNYISKCLLSEKKDTKRKKLIHLNKWVKLQTEQIISLHEEYVWDKKHNKNGLPYFWYNGEMYNKYAISIEKQNLRLLNNYVTKLEAE